MHRRELLRLLSVATVTVALPGEASTTSGGRLAAADIDQYTALNAHLWQVFGISRTKRLAYPLVRDQLAVLTAELGRGLPEAMRRQLCALACDLFQLAGEIAFDGNRYTDAAHCYALAATAGREAGTSDRWACALTRQAFISMYDKRHGEAAEILSAAARLTGKWDLGWARGSASGPPLWPARWQWAWGQAAGARVTVNPRASSWRMWLRALRPTSMRLA